LDLTRINDMPFYHCEEFASANDVVISINRLAVILRTTKEDEGSHCLFEYYQRVNINREHTILRRDSSVASLLQNDVPFDIVIPADII
jgi:hypothetical protein